MGCEEAGARAGSRHCLEEEGVIVMVLGFGDGRHGLETDRTYVLTNTL